MTWQLVVLILGVLVILVAYAGFSLWMQPPPPPPKTSFWKGPTDDKD